MKTYTKVLLTLSCIGLVGAAFLPLGLVGRNLNPGDAAGSYYHLEAKTSLSEAELSAGKATLMTKLNNPVDFSFTNASSLENGLVLLGEDGTFGNTSSINGITKIVIKMSGQIQLYKGYASTNVNLLVNADETPINITTERTFNLVDSANYFAIKALKETKIVSLDVFYSCYEAVASNVNLKTAVFADVQLQKKDRDSGAGNPNLGLTAHAYLALRNHLELAKEQNVDAIMMVGDIINNTSRNYYDLYKETFEAVYGKDESKYPAVIATMGNHEWWDLNEKTVANSVSMFNEYFFNTADATKVTSVHFSMDDSAILPTYYRVVNGVPFLMISGENCEGYIGDTMKAEIESWLKEIKELPSIRNGGQIYVGYHYPLSTTLTHGSNSLEQAKVLEDLLKDYPQAVVFTGDTHYSGVNERAINQVDFTSINIGTSSYSRVDRRSATMQEHESFYNLKDAKIKTSDVAIGNASFKYEYTPTIHMLNSYDDGHTIIDRYFSTDDAKNPTYINIPWLIPNNVNKSKFTYTNDRFVNTSSAQYYYGADGVSWQEGETLKYAKVDNKLLVRFNDTKQYHYTEHFKIEVTTDTSKTGHYDVVSNYYKYSLSPEELYFVLDELPEGNITKVSVQAFDYFDNPSLNTLEATSEASDCGFEPVEEIVSDRYSDISQRLNFVDTAPNSKSSLEYYYNGVYPFTSGAITTQIVNRDGKLLDNDYISLNDDVNQNVTLKAKVKNLSKDPLIVGLTLVKTKTEGGVIKEDWKTDFGGETRKTVPANSGWVELEWSLYDLYQFSCKDDIYKVQIKTKSANTSFDGYTMSFLIDDIDIYSKGTLKRVETLEDGWENMARDTGWERVNAVFDSDVACSNKSSSSLKCTFEGKEEKDNNKLGFILSPESQGINKGLNFNKGVLTAKIKFSSDITDFKVRLLLVDGDWKANRYDFDTTDFGNGWRLLTVDFANLPEPTFKDDAYDGLDIIRIGFGFHGVNESNQNNATVWVDEILWNK